MSSDIAVRVQHLSKCYRMYSTPRDRVQEIAQSGIRRILGFSPAQYGRDFWALKDVSLEVRKGESVAVLGRNGSGKSTLLQLICGTLTSTHGDIEVHGRLAALLELGAGFHPEFTGRENVRMYGTLLGLTKQELDERFDDMAGFADIGVYMDQPVKTYSSGMYLRLAFAVMAHVSADILVIDEAMAVGDVFFVQKCMRFLRRFMERGTVLFVSHDTDAVKNLCSRAFLLEQGVLTKTGTAKRVCDEYLRVMYESTVAKADARLTRPVQVSDSSPVFGTGKATIERVTLTNIRGEAKCMVTEKERVRLSISCRTSINLPQPIVGFVLRDRLGQVLFGKNSSSADAFDRPIEAGAAFTIVFEFWMPLLNVGEYTISVALAEGDQHSPVQHHWIHDALSVTSCPGEACFGSVGVEMVGITFHRQHDREPSHERDRSSVPL